MKKLLEKQITNINSELELVENVEKKIELRLAFAMLLHDLDGELEVIPEIPEGKEAIKETKKKKKTTKKKEEPVIEEKVEESFDEDDIPFPPKENEETFNDEDLQNTGIELQEEVTETPAPAKTEIIVEGVDITEVYNMLPFDIDEEEHQKIAYELTEIKEVIPVYQELIAETSLSHTFNTVRLAYHLVCNDLEVINQVLSEYSEGVLNDVYVDINDENVEAFNDHIDLLISQQEEE